MQSVVSRPHLPTLTSLRFIAALIVVLHHYALFLPLPSIINVWLAQGNTAVSFFFILSGFILSYTYAGRLESTLRATKTFLWARFARIYPLHGFLLLLITPITVWQIIAQPTIVQATVREELTPISLVGSWLSNALLVQIYPFESIHRRLWNLPAWSISSEVFFYALFPLLLPLIMRIQQRRSAIWWMIGIGLLQTALTVGWYIGCSVWRFGGSATTCISWGIYGNPLLRLGEFILGCIMGLVWLHTTQMERLTDRQRLKWIRIALLACFITMIIPQHIFGETSILIVLRWHILYIPWFCLIIFMCAWNNGQAWERWITQPLWILLGKASYAFYLCHWIPLVLLKYQHAQGKHIPAWLAVLTIIGCIGWSIVLHRWIEEPARKLLRRRTYVQNPNIVL